VTASRLVPDGSTLVVVEIHDPAGQRVAQKSETSMFRLFLQSEVALSWIVPATAPTGRYTVAVSIFSGDRSLVYAQNAQVGSFVVGSGPPPPPDGPLAFAVGTALVTPNPVTKGGAVHIDVAVTSNGPASGIIVDLELYDAGGRKVMQKVIGNQLFGVRHARNFSWTIQPVDLAVGTYTLKVGVFSSDWSTLYTWANQAGTISVGSGTPPPGPLTFTVGNAAVTPNPVSAGQTVRLDVPVTASGAASAILVDLELYNGAGTKVAQAVAPAQTFTAGQTRTYAWTITPVSLPAGTYTVKVGIFKTDWSTLYTWDGDAGTLTVR
jgi:hypothetical protein